MSAAVKTINAGVLAISYLEYGAAFGWPCITGHGFPYDAHAYDQAAPILAETGARVIVPYLRGYGPTRFLKAETPRSGEQSALGVDLMDFMDALRIEWAVLGGYDWGGRAVSASLAAQRSRIRFGWRIRLSMMRGWVMGHVRIGTFSALRGIKSKPMAFSALAVGPRTTTQPQRHGGACRGHPRRSAQSRWSRCWKAYNLRWITRNADDDAPYGRRAWMAGSSPAMTAKDRRRGRNETYQEPAL